MAAWLLFLSLCVAAEEVILDWKGREMGDEAFPSWLKRFAQDGDEKPARKQFAIEREKRLILCCDSNLSLEMARQGARAKARLEVAGGTGLRTLGGFSEVTEFWQEIGEDGKTHFVVYKLFETP